MEGHDQPPAGLRGILPVLGPGLVLAATGVGVGDLVAAAVAGSTHGYALVWAALVGAAMKFAVTEGMARWQLATGSTLLEGWVRHLGPIFCSVFLVYLVLWSFVVGGALVSACGLAGHSLFPGLSVATWGVIHSLVVALVVLLGEYRRFETLIKVFVGLMFLTLVGAAAVVAPPADTLRRIVEDAAVPVAAVPFAVAVIGGVGGSVTLLSYGYWIRERGWRGPAWLRVVRWDLGLAYALTGLFGVAVMVLAAVTLTDGAKVEGGAGVVRMAAMIEPLLGRAGQATFLIGFWAAVATSMLGVWQGIPYLFCDFVRLMKARAAGGEAGNEIDPRSASYRSFLFWLAIPPLSLLALDKPVAVIIAYAVAGGFFMPVVCATLLYMNCRRAWVGELRYRFAGTVGLGGALVLFGWLGYRKLVEVLL